MTERGRSLDLGGRRQRALLARLLLDANRVVSVERLIDDLWGEQIPPTAPKMVQVYVSKLRKALPEGTLETHTPGYIVRTEGSELDLRRFEQLLADGRAAMAQSDAAAAARLFAEALGLWRGPALADFSEPFVRPEQARLEELRLTCLEERIDAELALGRHAELVADLESLVGHHPLRERLRRQLMLALYGSGRQADALAAYRSFRETLDEELGIEPSAGLKELEGRMLRQEPGLVEQIDEKTISPPDPLPTRAALVEPVEILHARSGDVRIAYQVLGEGPPDLVLVHGWVCTFQPGWENPKIAGFYRRLASMGRLILFDKRGTGLSDRVSTERLPNLETRMDDVRAVMDAVGVEEANLLGVSEGGPMTALFAATYPGRTSGLVFMGTFARMLKSRDYPIGILPEEYDKRVEPTLVDDWARATTAEWLGRVAPDLLADEEAFRWYVSYVIRGASPEANRAMRLMNRDIDIRNVLPAINAPSLVVYRAQERFAAATRAMGEQIRGARIVELPGHDHLPWEGDQSAVLDEIEKFLTTTETQVDADRRLVTLLAIDLANRGEREERGEEADDEALHRFRGLLDEEVERFRGRLVAGGDDASLAIFDGPARAIQCAALVVERTLQLGFEAQAGLHTGEVELVDGSVRGIAVELASRVARQSAPGEVHVTHTVRDLVAGSRLEFDDDSERALEGMPGRWRVLRVRTPATVAP